MERKREREKVNLSVTTVITVIVLIASIVVAIWIMIHHMGLSDSLDFGAGAYYYADMPGFERWTNKEYYHSQIPIWILITIFLIWGAAMMKLWIYIDCRAEDKKGKIKQTEESL